MVSHLPPHLTSLYRLCLRATSTSVLHHSAATSALRKLFRPSFREAVKVTRELENDRSRGLNDASVIAKERWLEEWNQRADNTLSLLLNSATSQGLAHNLTRNLSRLQSYYNTWVEMRLYTSRGEWNPSLPHDDRRYKDPQFAAEHNLIRGSNRREQALRQQKTADVAWGAMAEVVRMAEGRDKLWLGRVSYRRRRA